jgi:hypothetical protein
MSMGAEPPLPPPPVEAPRKCPFCAEAIQAAAAVCRHCGEQVPSEFQAIHRKGNRFLLGTDSSDRYAVWERSGGRLATFERTEAGWKEAWECFHANEQGSKPVTQIRAGSQQALLPLIGGAAVVVGSLLPWGTVTTVFGSVSIAGTEGDGKITLALGGALVLIAVLEMVGQISASKWVLGLVAAGAAGVAGYDWLNISQRLGEVQSEYARASVGIGLQVAALGGVLALVGALVRPDGSAP